MNTTNPKVIYPKRIDGKFCACPFVGHTINNLREFAQILMDKYYDKNSGYPGLFFNTSDPNLVLLFSGHQYEHGKEGKWALFNRKTDNWPSKWFKFSELASYWNLLYDAKKQQDQINTITKIVNITGGITVIL